MKEKILFAAVMGTITTGLVSLTIVSVNKGFISGFMAIWVKSWLISYIVAVPAILIIGPKVQLILNRLVETKANNQ